MERSSFTLLILAVFFLGMRPLLSQDIVWSRTYGGNLDESLSSMLLTKDGEYLIAASASSKNGDISEPPELGCDPKKVWQPICYFGWMVRLDPSGEIKWDRIFGDTLDQTVYDIQRTNDGGYLLIGSSMTPEDLDTSEDHHINNSHYWATKTDSNGEIEWNRIFGNGKNNRLEGVLPFDDGGFVLIGNGEDQNEEQGSYLIKIDQKGRLEWEKELHAGTRTYVNSINTSDGDGFIVSGKASYKGLAEDGYIGLQRYLRFWGWKNTGVWVKKFNWDGEVVWNKIFYKKKDSPKLDVIQTTKDGGYILLGSIKRSDGQHLYSSKMGYDHTDVWIIKLSKSGEKEWEQVYGGRRSDIASHIIQTKDEGYVFVGSSLSHEKFEGSDFTNQVWLVKLDRDGNMEWEEFYGGGGKDRGLIVRQKENGDLMVGAETASTDGDLKGRDPDRHSKGLTISDIWIFRVRNTEDE